MNQITTLSIDPGTRSTGWATWYDDNTLEAAGCGPFDSALIFARAMRGVHLVLEVPHAVRGDARADNIITLAFAAGRLAGAHGGHQSHLRPEEWKRQLPKPKRASDPYIVWERCKAELAENERERIEWPGSKRDRWDVADAIGLGLVALGRLRPGLV